MNKFALRGSLVPNRSPPTIYEEGCYQLECLEEIFLAALPDISAQPNALMHCQTVVPHPLVRVLFYAEQLQNILSSFEMTRLLSQIDLPRIYAGLY